MAKLRYLLVFVACLVTIWVDKGTACNPKLINSDIHVCVCSETHRCDGELEHLNHVSKEKGVVTSFVTSKAGSRLAQEQHNFTSTFRNQTYNIQIELDRSKRHQKIIGFGGAFTDSAGWNIARLPKVLQSRLIKDYFAPDGLEYTVARTTIGGCDFSLREYSLDDHPKDETLSTFALQPEDFNYKLPYMKMAKNLSKHTLKFFGSAWSSPSWMKTNHQLSHGGFLRGNPGGPYYKAYAQYTIKFLQAYAKQNVSMWGVTIVNEPGIGNPGWGYNTLGFTSKTQRDYIKLDLGPELAKAGLGHVAVMHYDWNTDHIDEYVDDILGDNETAKYVAGTAYHWYNHGTRNKLERITKLYPGKFLLMTEACSGLPPKGISSWYNFNEYADDILRVLNMGVQGWVDWNMVLDMKGGPSWAHNIVDAPIHVSEDGREYYKVPIYYAMGHFSKFIVPDSVRITANTQVDHTAGENVLVTAFERPDKSTVLTVLNKNSHKVSLKVHDAKQGYLTLDLAPDSMDSLIWY